MPFPQGLIPGWTCPIPSSASLQIQCLCITEPLAVTMSKLVARGLCQGVDGKARVCCAQFLLQLFQFLGHVPVVIGQLPGAQESVGAGEADRKCRQCLEQPIGSKQGMHPLWKFRSAQVCKQIGRASCRERVCQYV